MKLPCVCRALDTAFQDLSALMQQAQDMVAIAERFRATRRCGLSDKSITSWKPCRHSP